MTAPSNANTSGLPPTDALRLVSELAAKGANTPGCNNWRSASMCRQIVEVLDKAAPASPLTGGGDEALIAELKEARGLLEPFALAADDLDDDHGDRGSIWEAPAAMNIDAGDLRAARAFLARNGKGEG